MSDPDDRQFSSPVCYADIAADPVCHVADWRTAERRRLRGERMAQSVQDRADVAQALTAHLEDLVGKMPGRVLSGYWPIKGEPDLRDWLGRQHAAGRIIALPVVEQPGAPLVFRRWIPGMAMVRGHWNIPVPPQTAERLTPDIALAPLVGWDRAGYRLGYGGGYFDRTLAALDPRPRVIGIGLQSARLLTIHPQPHDIAMDWIVTECGIQSRA
jgi:5,10-methenyltetrahydrofolate synthetase